MIVFIGAGVSTLFGIPDTQGFVEIFDNKPEISQSGIYGAIKETFSYVDLEVLMTVLEDLGKLGHELLGSVSPQTADFLIKNREQIDYYLHDKGVKMQSRNLIKTIKDTIKEECLRAETEKKDEILDIYDRFLETLSRLNQDYTSGDRKVKYPGDLRFFTTNYDRCLETYFRLHEIDFAQGLVQKYGCLYFDVSSFKDKGRIIGLFKLHGAIDLFNIDGEIRQRRYGEETGDEVVYYPIEFSGYRHIIESPYLELFYLFRERLNQDFRGIWIIAGSSLRDRTICSIMNDVIRLKPEGQRPKVIFVNPDKAVTERLEAWGFIHLQERISQHHIQRKFGSDETNETILHHLQR